MKNCCNKQAHPNKRASRENYFMYYKKKCVQGGKNVSFIAWKFVTGWIFKKKC